MPLLAQSLACVSVCVFPGCAVSLVSPRPGLSHASRDRGSIPLASLWPVPAAFCLCQPVSVTVTAVGFEPTPLWTGAWSQRLRPLGQTVMWHHVCKAIYPLSGQRLRLPRRTRVEHGGQGFAAGPQVSLTSQAMAGLKDMCQFARVG